MSKTSSCHLLQYTKTRSEFALPHTNKSTKAELPHFILAVFIMACNMRFIGGLLLLLTLICVSPANAYQLEGYKWPQPTTTFYVDIPGAGGLWNDSFEKAMYYWGVDTIFEYKIVRGVYEDPCDPPEGRNGVSFESTVCGDAWGRTTIAITWLTFIGSTFYQTDIVFNSNESWNVYSTSWWSGSWFGINDFQRVAVHELGHALGLDDEDSGVPTIMAPYAGNITIPQQDDVNGVAAIYGAVPTYFDTVQKTYIGYYQRPADPCGLIYWAERLYATGGNLTEIIEAFANSAESQALYGTINSSNISTVVNGIYNALFGRNAEAGGLSYYVNGFNSGHFTAATIMLNVLYGAQNEDLQSINNKLTAANLFTRTIDPELDGKDFQYNYSGNCDAQVARDFLLTATWDPATIPTEDEIRAFLEDMEYTCGLTGSAGITDSNGKVTLTSNGLTVPVRLTDQDTGTPLSGIAVGLGNDPTVPGSAILLIAEASQNHPLQIILLESAAAPTSSAAKQSQLLDSSTVSVAVQSGCPTQSGTTASKAIKVPSIPFPKGATLPTQAGIAKQLVNGINALLGLSSGYLPTGFQGPVSIETRPANPNGTCMQDIIEIVSTVGVHEAFVFLMGWEAEIPIVAGLVIMSPELAKYATSCYYSALASIPIQEICWGYYCFEVPQSPTITPTSYPVNATLPANASGEALFVSSEVLGMTEVGTINNGTGIVYCTAGSNTVCVNSPGYAQYVQQGFTVSAPGTPLNVTLTPLSPTTFTISITIAGTGSGTVACSGANCSQPIASGTKVTLTESPKSGLTFSGWGGACSSFGTGTTCTLTVTQDEIVTANFAATQQCCGCYFDVYCTIPYGPGGCWYCHTSSYNASGVCPMPSGYPSYTIIAPGACPCSPGLYQVCQ